MSPTESPGAANPRATVEGAGSEIDVSSIAPDATDSDDDIVDGRTTTPLTVDESRELHRLLRGRRPIHADERSELGFRRWQQCWRRRISASRRMAPLDNGVVDSLAPNGQRWAA